MKLHEIDWTDGKRYNTVIGGTKLELYVRNRCLLHSHNDFDIQGQYHLKALAEADFTPIIEPVTFLKAYQDCLENGTEYKREDGSVKMFKEETRFVSIETLDGSDYLTLNICGWIKEETK